MDRFGSEGDPGRPHEGFGAWDFDPAKVFAQFGAPFAMLVAPPVQRRQVGQLFGDSSPTGTPIPTPGPVLPVALTIRHLLAGGGIVDVVTRRTYGHTVDLLDHMWLCLIEWRLADPPAVDMPALQSWASGITLRPRPDASPGVELQIDEMRRPAAALVDDDLLVYGCQSGDALIAVVAPVSVVALHRLHLATWRPEAAQ